MSPWWLLRWLRLRLRLLLLWWELSLRAALSRRFGRRLIEFCEMLLEFLVLSDDDPPATLSQGLECLTVPHLLYFQLMLKVLSLLLRYWRGGLLTGVIMLGSLRWSGLRVAD